jgi:hypothetical protein
VKAARQDFSKSNLSVITSDGKLYCFSVEYSPEPKELYLSFAKDSLARFGPDSLNTAKLEQIAALVAAQKRFMNQVIRSERMSLALRGIYVDHSLIWLVFEIDNKSLIDYRPDYFRLSVADRKKVKRVPSQEMKIRPVYQPEIGLIAGGESRTLVFGIQPAGISKAKVLMLSMSERGGNRGLRLGIKPGVLLKGRGIG